MSRQRSSGPAVIVFLVIALVVLFAILKRPHPRESRRPTLKSSVPEESSVVRPGDRPHGSQPGSGQSLDSSCPLATVTCDSEYFAHWQPPDTGSCTPSFKNGYQLPDPRCTPGGIDPSVTVDILRDPQWRTGCIRNCQSSERQKHAAYAWYALLVPPANTGKGQTCELDHLVPLELGGADGMGNIWPECGPAAAMLEGRYFKIKDRVENYLASEVKTGRMPLSEAQRGIAEDWTQYLAAANSYCEAGGRCGGRRAKRAGEN
jgi:hypothetical protein